MEIRFIASEIRTGTVANGFGGCPTFFFFPLGLTRRNEVFPPDGIFLAATFRATVRPRFTPATFFLSNSRGERPSISVNRRARDCDIGFKQSTFIASDYKVVLL